MLSDSVVIFMPKVNFLCFHMPNNNVALCLKITFILGAQREDTTSTALIIVIIFLGHLLGLFLLSLIRRSSVRRHGICPFQDMEYGVSTREEIGKSCRPLKNQRGADGNVYSVLHDWGSCKIQWTLDSSGDRSVDFLKSPLFHLSFGSPQNYTIITHCNP